MKRGLAVLFAVLAVALILSSCAGRVNEQPAEENAAADENRPEETVSSDYIYAPGSKTTVTEVFSLAYNLWPGPGSQDGFRDGRMPVSDHNIGKCGYIDMEGNVVISCEYGYTTSFSEGFAAVLKDDLGYGYIDINGDVIIPFEYGESHPFSEGVAAMCGYDDKWGCLNAKGEVVIPFEYHFIADFKNGKTNIYTASSEWFDFYAEGYEASANRHIIDFFEDLDEKISQSTRQSFQTHVVFPAGHDDHDYLFYGRGEQDELWPVLENGKWGYADRDGRIVVPCEYPYVYRFCESRAVVWYGESEYGILNKSGEFVSTFECNSALYHTFKNGRLLIEKDGKRSVIDIDGNEVFICEYDVSYQGFSNGLLWVKNDENWGVIDINGNIVIPFEISIPVNIEPEPFHDGIAIMYNVTDINSAGYSYNRYLIDTSGEKVFSDEYILIDREKETGLYMLSKDGVTGFYRIECK